MVLCFAEFGLARALNFVASQVQNVGIDLKQAPDYNTAYRSTAVIPKNACLNYGIKFLEIMVELLPCLALQV